MGGNNLLQPDPRDDDVAESLQVDHAVGHRCFDVTAGEQFVGYGDEAAPCGVELFRLIAGFTSQGSGVGDGLSDREPSAVNPAPPAVELCGPTDPDSGYRVCLHESG